MFNDVHDSDKDEVDEDDTFPLHISMASQGSKWLKSGQVSSIYILLTSYSIFSLSAPTSAMQHGMPRYIASVS